MTDKTITYRTRALMDADIKPQQALGFRQKNINHINNDESQGYRVVYTTDGYTPELPKRQLTERQLLDELAKERNSEII